MASTLLAQTPGRTTYEIHGHVLDSAGLPVAYARISLETRTGVLRTQADGQGAFRIPLHAADAIAIQAKAGGLVSGRIGIPAGTAQPGDLKLTLHPEDAHEQVTVTTTRTAVEMGPGTNTVSTLSQQDLMQYPALTLDERLEQHAGFQLFRRYSGWVANPTSEGISLRGLGSTAASRTLVLMDQVPLNDPFGGWIHWNELPPNTIEAVAIATGGGSDLYGSSALGGVIDIIPARPAALAADLDLAEAGENTTPLSARLDASKGNWGALVAGQSFRTAGYTVVAPAVRGPVDIPSNVHFQNGHTELDRTMPGAGRLFLLGNLLNEARDNGTRIQTNGTRLWRYIGGDDWTANALTSGRVRIFGSDEAYRQSFSAVNASRSNEKLTRLQNVRTQELGGSADASLHLKEVALVAGADLRDLRATDVEHPISAGKPSGLQDTSARQRFSGAFGEILAQHGKWSGAASLRADQASNLDTHTLSGTAAAGTTTQALPDRHELVFSPRVGLVRQLPRGIALHASGFRAFRAPTMNELYRTGQVGQQITLANASLLSERATGVEAGPTWSSPGGAWALQATYFWTEINRPVSAVLLRRSATAIVNQRENLGQIQSQGVELSAQTEPLRGLSLSFGYQYAHATVTAFAAQPALVGLWIPQVPRHSATAQLRYRLGALSSITLAARESGRAFDDSSNIYQLHSFFVLDAYAERRLGPYCTAYLSLQNLFNRSIEVARTPDLTLGTPFVAQGGVRVHWGRQ